MLCSSFPDHIFFFLLPERGSSSCCIEGLLMFSDTLGWLQGPPLLLRSLCHMLSFSHPAKPHNPQGLASISSAAAFHSFFEITQLMISSSKLLEEMSSDPSIPLSRKCDRWKQEKPGACATTRQFVSCILSVYLKSQDLSLA